MLSRSLVAFVALSALSLSEPVLGRMRWMEREARPVHLHPRRFGQEHATIVAKLAAACPGPVCQALAGQAMVPLLSGQVECAQQDFADAIIDASCQFDEATQDLMVSIAKEYRQLEKNTPPDLSTTPPTYRNSVYCQKAPENAELNGLVQAQDPDNAPDVFYDPLTQNSVLKGSQANTYPFTGPRFTTQLGARAAADIGSFGSCSVPQIKFGVGFDNRKETSFESADQKSFNHGSADNIDIITQFICDTLTNSCGADATAKATCATAQKAADGQTPKTGAQADAFNAVFGIKTDFAAITEVNDQGQVVAGTGSDSASVAVSSAAAAAATAAPASSVASSGSSAAAASAAAVVSSAASSASSIGSFGSCSVPQIKFGTGFDNRKETAFEPVDQKSFNHGSADNIGVITDFICNTLTNTCGADATAKATCATAQAAANAATAKSGAQADAFNAVFGITTDFAAVPEVDDTGNVIAGTGSGAAAAASSTDDATATASTDAAAAAATATVSAAAAAATASALSSIGNFGKCSVPQIEFGVGFDNRRETSFQPVDQTSFNHGSADNIDIITQFICDTLTNSCGADATAKATCASAQKAADEQTPKTGAQADAFNAVFGIKTDFAAVAEVNDQGDVVAA
ncbi:hypothetical protein BV25DRAFT_1913944 [Artomyces pyxidatus]|uniref:Uncharacterized protein n=1 Tax=Artomyces pyxidatus TaxID=48021 RepID=A0ACB8T9B9_9AGAM|nr:hypothetical protein BV25DRAFT_1913944 [Artomyces pyxidatus]